MPISYPFWTTPLSYRSTLYLESNESPEGSYFLDRGQIARKIQVDWEARNQAIEDFGGTVTVLYNGSGQGYLNRSVPHAFPARPWMYVQSIPKEMPIAIRGNSGGTTDGLGVATYEICELTLVYAMPTYKIKADEDVLAAAGPLAGLPDEGRALERGYNLYSRFITRVPKYSSKILVLNKGMLKDSDGKLIVEGLPLPEPGGEIQYTWHQVPEECLPQLVWIANCNVVNDAEFDGWPAGTLLFDGVPEFRSAPNPMTGQILSDVTYRFKISIKPDLSDDPPTILGHNYVYRLTPAPTRVLIPKLVTTDGVGAAAGSTLFREFDFKKFFRPQPVA